MRLSGKVAVVTGAGSGMGRSTALLFAREGASSVAGVSGAAAGAVYTASKHALLGLTRNTAYTYAPFGIRCNALIVGGVETNIMSGADPATFDHEALAQYGKWHAANPRTLQPDEVANLTLFLSSDEASGINGAAVPVDGGWTAAG